MSIRERARYAGALVTQDPFARRGGPSRFAWSVVAVVAIALTTIALPLHAADALPTERDPVAESRAVRLSEKLRCLVCQNQTIAESNAELALDLRRQIHEQIAAGKTDDEILAYMTARYGDFVLYQPPVKSTTLLLWGGPALLLIGGFFVLMRVLRARRAQPEEAPLTAADRERAAKLLAGETGKESS